MGTQRSSLDQLISKLIKLYQSDEVHQMQIDIGEALARYPESSELFNLQGSAHFKSKQFQNAVESFERALSLQPANQDIVLNLAKAHLSNSAPALARKCLSEFLAGCPNSAEVYFQLGIIEQKMGDLDDAIKSFESSLKLRPVSAGAHNNLGLIWAAKKNWIKAIEHYQSAIAANPDSARSFNNLGVAFQREGKFDRSAEALQSAIALRPDYLEAHENLGDTLRLAGHLERARNSYKSVIEIDPHHSRAHACIGICLHKEGSHQSAINSLKEAISIDTENAGFRFSLSQIYASTGEFDSSLDELQRCIELKPGFIEAHKNKCEILEKLNRIGQLETALSAAQESIDTFGNEFGYFQARVNFRNKNYEEALKLIESLSLNDSTDEEIIRAFKLQADCLNALGKYEAAFDFYTRMNQQVRANTDFDWHSSDYYFSRVEAHRKALSSIIDTPYADQHNQHPQTQSPVFLIGFPRSGTTLLDTILRSHSEISVLEEKPTIAHTLEGVRKETGIAELESIDESEKQKLRDRYFQELNKHVSFQHQSCTIDKMPLNSIHAPLIARLFPHAKIIFMVRHPMDCILSCYMQNFKLNAAMGNMLDLDRIVSLYCNVMQLWESSDRRYEFNVKYIRYEDLITNFQTEISGLLDFLDLEWEQGLTDYRRTAEERGRINTPSYSQVVQPLYQSASYRWRNYKFQLDRFVDEIQPWIERFEYES